MLFIVRAMVFLLNTALAASGVTLTLTAAPVAPEGGTSLGTTGVVPVGVATLTFSRGTGPSQTTFFTGYWNTSGS